MKYAHLLPNGAAGFVAHRRSFGDGLRTGAVAPRKPTTDAMLFAWLLAPQNTPRLVPVTVRARQTPASS